MENTHLRLHLDGNGFWSFNITLSYVTRINQIVFMCHLPL